MSQPDRSRLNPHDPLAVRCSCTDCIAKRIQVAVVGARRAVDRTKRVQPKTPFKPTVSVRATVTLLKVLWPWRRWDIPERHDGP